MIEKDTHIVPHAVMLLEEAVQHAGRLALRLCDIHVRLPFFDLSEQLIHLIHGQGAHLVVDFNTVFLGNVIPDDESVCIRHVADGGETVNFPVDCRSLDKVSLYVQKPLGMLLHHFLIETHDFVGGDIGRECRPCRSVVQVQLLPAGNHKIDLLIVVCPRHRKQFHTRTDLLLHQLVQVFLHQIPVRLLHPHVECVYNRVRLFAVLPDR